MSRYHPIEAACIDWHENIPKCRNFGDIYFSTDGGLDESRHVFLNGNDLPQRWQNVEQLTIAETGFGTGLNFLCTLEAWFNSAPDNAQLNYLSVEKHPLTQADLQQALSIWPTLNKFTRELITHYPPLTYGLHQRSLFNDRVRLTLMLGDATDMLADVNFQADAWYLDGFAPSKNPGMWNEKLFQQIACHTKSNGSFATFTAAGVVRRGLKAAGFEVKTIPGHGRKRDMSIGRISHPPKTKSKHPWFVYPLIETKTKQAVVIGAGLAGCTVGHSLAKQGWQITLIERHNQIAQEASGNLAGVVMPRLTADMSAEGQFYLSAFLHTNHWLNQLKKRDPSLPWFKSGVLQLCDEKQQQRMARLDLPENVMKICDTTAATSHCGLQTKRGGLFFPGGGWLNPPALCNWLLGDQIDNISTLLNQEALTLKRDAGIWQVVGGNSVIAEAENVIITNAYDAERLLGIETFKLQKVRGQLTYVPTTKHSKALKTPVCYDGYVVPVYKNLHCVGASYDLVNESTEIDPQSGVEILAKLNKELTEFEANHANAGRVAHRTTTQDHLPIIGPVPNTGFYQKEYTDLHHGKPARCYPNAKYLPNLLISVGHGSRGLVSCHYAAHLIASVLTSSGLTSTHKTHTTVHPGRFLIRNLKLGVKKND